APAAVPLPAVALSYVQRWQNTYQPIYVAHGIASATPADAAFAHVPVNTLVPFPAIPPAAHGPNPRVAAEQHGLLPWFQRVPNPPPPAATFYLAQLTTPDVYSYEQIRAWDSNQLANYLRGVRRAAAPGVALGNAVTNLPANTLYRSCWRDWANPVQDVSPG